MFRPGSGETFPAGRAARPTGGGGRAMLVAQITDTHLGFEPGHADEPNRRRLDALVAQLNAMHRVPDMVLVTGDLVDRGDEGSYRALREALAPLAMPVHLCLGNHDARAPFRAVFPETACDADGFVQSVVETPVLRLILLDTLEEGRHGGAFCAVRARWLAARLAEDRVRPTLIALHHPPFDTGIPWLTTAPDAPWTLRLRDALAGADNVVGLIAGHVHRPIVTQWAGRGTIVCPSSAAQVALDLAPIAADDPDGRAMIVGNPPGLALHWWSGERLVTHFADTAETPVLARFDARMRGLVAGMMGEQPA